MGHQVGRAGVGAALETEGVGLGSGPPSPPSHGRPHRHLSDLTLPGTFLSEPALHLTTQVSAPCPLSRDASPLSLSTTAPPQALSHQPISFRAHFLSEFFLSLSFFNLRSVSPSRTRAPGGQGLCLWACPVPGCAFRGGGPRTVCAGITLPGLPALLPDPSRSPQHPQPSFTDTPAYDSFPLPPSNPPGPRGPGPVPVARPTLLHSSHTHLSLIPDQGLGSFWFLCLECSSSSPSDSDSVSSFGPPQRHPSERSLLGTIPQRQPSQSHSHVPCFTVALNCLQFRIPAFLS